MADGSRARGDAFCFRPSLAPYQIRAVQHNSVNRDRHALKRASQVYFMPCSFACSMVYSIAPTIEPPDSREAKKEAIEEPESKKEK